MRYRWKARRRFSFDRVRLGPGPVLRSAAGAAPEEATSPRPVPRRDRAGADAPIPSAGAPSPPNWTQTVVNDTQARRHWQAAAAPGRGAGYDDLESLVVDGHPYHPSYKSRLGFNAVRQRRSTARSSPG